MKKEQQSPFGDLAGILQLLPLLQQSGGGLDDIAQLAQFGIAEQQQQNQVAHNQERNQLYERSIQGRQQAAQQVDQRALAELALKQQAEQRMGQMAQFTQGLGLSRLGLDTQNADMRNQYLRQLMQKAGIAMQGDLQNQELMRSLMGDSMGDGSAPNEQTQIDLLKFLPQLQQPTR